MQEQSAGTRTVEESLGQVIAASDAIVARMDEQREETERMAAYLASALKRLADLAASSRSQAAAVDELRQSFAAVRYEADRNLASVEALSKALEGFKV
jgi:methyl-accepting chemotaxis protein